MKKTLFFYLKTTFTNKKGSDWSSNWLSVTVKWKDEDGDGSAVSGEQLQIFVSCSVCQRLQLRDFDSSSYSLQHRQAGRQAGAPQSRSDRCPARLDARRRDSCADAAAWRCSTCCFALTFYLIFSWRRSRLWRLQRHQRLKLCVFCISGFSPWWMCVGVQNAFHTFKGQYFPLNQDI